MCLVTYSDAINGASDWIVRAAEVSCCVAAGTFNFSRSLPSATILTAIFVMTTCFSAEFSGSCDGKNFTAESYPDSIYSF